MSIWLNDEINFQEWDRLVANSLFHTRKWISIITDTYGGTPFFAMAQSGGEYSLIAACKKGSRYISLSHTHIAGFLSNSEKLTSELELLLVKSGILIRYKKLENYLPDADTVNSIVEIGDMDVYWASLSSNMRNQIRKAQRVNELEFSTEATVEEFYDVISRNMHRLGTPVHALKFYQNIKERIDSSRIYSVRFEGKTVAAMFGLYANDLLQHKEPTFFNLWASTLPEFDKHYVNYLLYWKMLEETAGSGVRYVDLGTSINGSGVFKFKQKLNAKHSSVNEYVVGRLLPVESYKQSASAKILSEFWKRMPYPLSLRFGPLLRKHLA